jgi:hypothetical protein
MARRWVDMNGQSCSQSTAYHYKRPQCCSLGSHPRVNLIDPLDYEALVHVLKRSYVIMTDSGGIHDAAFLIILVHASFPNSAPWYLLFFFFFSRQTYMRIYHSCVFAWVRPKTNFGYEHFIMRVQASLATKTTFFFLLSHFQWILSNLCTQSC